MCVAVYKKKADTCKTLLRCKHHSTQFVLSLKMQLQSPFCLRLTVLKLLPTLCSASLLWLASTPPQRTVAVPNYLRELNQITDRTGHRIQDVLKTVRIQIDQHLHEVGADYDGNSQNGYSEENWVTEKEEKNWSNDNCLHLLPASFPLTSRGHDPVKVRVDQLQECHWQHMFWIHCIYKGLMLNMWSETQKWVLHLCFSSVLLKDS